MLYFIGLFCSPLHCTGLYCTSHNVVLSCAACAGKASKFLLDFPSSSSIILRRFTIEGAPDDDDDDASDDSDDGYRARDRERDRGRRGKPKCNLQALLTPKVWTNAVGFVRLVDVDFYMRKGPFPHPLEFTRIHPAMYSRAVEVTLLPPPPIVWSDPGCFTLIAVAGSSSIVSLLLFVVARVIVVLCQLWCCLGLHGGFSH